MFSWSLKVREKTLEDFWKVEVSKEGFLKKNNMSGFVFEGEGLDVSLSTPKYLRSLHSAWRSTLQFTKDEEIQIVFRKRVEFSRWIEKQLHQVFLGESAYGRRVILDRIADQVSQMSSPPRILSQKIIICFWTREKLNHEELEQKRVLIKNQLEGFGFAIRPLEREAIQKEIFVSCQDLEATENQEMEWPQVTIKPGRIQVRKDTFRSLGLSRLPESFTEIGMITSITKLPFPMDVCLRIKGRDSRPVINGLKRKRNLLLARKGTKSAPELESQIDQIDQVLRNLADSSDVIVDIQMTVGLRLPEDLSTIHRRALALVIRAGTEMDFSEFEECTLDTFDSYLECIPTFFGRNIRQHTVLSSNAIHFLPFFRPSMGDRKPIITFRTGEDGIYGIDPIDPRLANYNWLVSGTSGSGKSFFVNSLIAQSESYNPNVYVVDIGGSYNRLTNFLGGRVLSLDTEKGFELSPFFLEKSSNEGEEQLRRQHIFQIFLEICRTDGKLPSLEARHLLRQVLEEIFELETLPEHPISNLVDQLSRTNSAEARHLVMSLQPWTRLNFFGRFLDNSKGLSVKTRIQTFDLKGLTEFQDLSRVVQFIVCAHIWAKIRQNKFNRFNWIILDEVAFSLLKAQPDFVDELVSTIRKHNGGVIIVVQDLEKITASLAGSSILQNTQTKAILQQRGDQRNYSEVLSLSKADLAMIDSLDRRKGTYSEIFLIRENEKVLIRHVPGKLEYLLATTSPEDVQLIGKSLQKFNGNSFPESVLGLYRELWHKEAS